MPSTALLRKAILSVLQEKIIPDLSKKATRRLVMAGAQIQAPPGVAVRAMDHAPLREEDAQKVYPQGKRWEAVHMHSMRFPVLVCVTEGEADIQFGVTAAMLTRSRRGRDSSEGCGGYIVSLAAPAYFLLPPEVPVAEGGVRPWQRPEPHTGTTGFYYLQVLPVGALCKLMSMKNGVFEVQYSLLVEDALLAASMGILIDEMSTPEPDLRIARAQLLTLMLRIERDIRTRIPYLTDGLYSRFPEGVPAGLEARLTDNPVIEKARQFIEFHLHEMLTPSVIAAHVRMTPAQLNIIFRKSVGMSVMAYVTRMRIETAQLLLRTSNLSVREIGHLVGFRQQAHFSRTFHSHVGSSPLKFRQRLQNELPRRV